MDCLVTPLDLITFQVDEHVSQASGDPHEHRGQAEKDPRTGPQAPGQPARNEENDDDRQEYRPRSPTEQTLPEQKAPLDRSFHNKADAAQDRGNQPDPVQDARQHACSSER